MDINDIKAAYSIYSFERARQEGKVWQWVFTHLLVFILKCILLYPVIIIWRWTGDRTHDGMAHFIQFALFSLMYYALLVTLVTAPFHR